MKLPTSVKAWIEGQVSSGHFKDFGDCVATLVRESSAVPTLRSWDELDAMLERAVRNSPPRPMTSRDWERIRRAGEAGAARRRTADRTARRSAC